jgi:hypothetical protein
MGDGPNGEFPHGGQAAAAVGKPSRVSYEVAAALAAIDVVRRQDIGGRVAADQASDLRELERGINLLRFECARRAAAVDRSQLPELEGACSTEDWMRDRCNMSSYEAWKQLTVGTHAGSLSGSVEALAEGRIGWTHLTLMADAAAALGKSETSAPFDERQLLPEARRMSPGAFRKACLHYRHAMDPARYADDQRINVEFRELSYRDRGDGIVDVWGALDSAGWAVIQGSLEPLARRNGKDDDRDRERRLADAWVEAASLLMGSGVLPDLAAVAPQVQVTTTLETFLGLAGAPAAELEYSLPISQDVLDRLTCNCTVTSVLFGADSAIHDVSASRRVVSGPTRRALRARDGCCRWPGCDRTASLTEPHHVKHWSRGGPTSLPNLVSLCCRHHWKVHEGGWKMVYTQDDEVLVIPPGGHAYARAPGQPPPA